MVRAHFTTKAFGCELFFKNPYKIHKCVRTLLDRREKIRNSLILTEISCNETAVEHFEKNDCFEREACMPQWHGPWRKRRPPNTAI